SRHQVFLDVEADDLAGESRGQWSGIESSYGFDAALAARQAVPVRRCVHSDGIDDADAGQYHATIGNRHGTPKQPERPQNSPHTLDVPARSAGKRTVSPRMRRRLVG